MGKNILVSVMCITYNHENYIEDALKSFINQDTDFDYEIIVHDDASTDETANIIKKYENEYPDLIKPIYETENQYSKNLDFNRLYLKYTTGKYIAICEGDDYWTDKKKLQKQADYMEKNLDCTLCFHDAIWVNTKRELIRDSYIPTSLFHSKYFVNDYHVYSTDDMIKLDMVPTASLMFRKKNVNEVLSFTEGKGYVCGDLPIRLVHSSLGHAYYIPEKMSAHITGIKDSASQLASSSLEAQIETLSGHLKILNDFNVYTNGKYKDSIDETKTLKIFLFFYSKMSIGVLDSNKFKEIFERIRNIDRFKYKIKCNFLGIYKFYCKLKNIKAGWIVEKIVK